MLCTRNVIFFFGSKEQKIRISTLFLFFQGKITDWLLKIKNYFLVIVIHHVCHLFNLILFFLFYLVKIVFLNNIDIPIFFFWNMIISLYINFVNENMVVFEIFNWRYDECICNVAKTILYCLCYCYIVSVVHQIT